MKIFKTVDDRISELGFTKEMENKFGVTYTREIKEYGYIQVVDILHKASGRHILQSYDRNMMDEKKIGNTCVGLTYTELRLFSKKMAKIGLKDR